MAAFAEVDEDAAFDNGDFDDAFMEDGDILFEEDMTFDAVAQAIGIDVEALFTELDSGKSIADVATANGVDPQAIVDLMIAEENKFIDELIASGEITEEEAAEWKAESAEYTPFMVNSSYVDPFVVAAQAIGIDAETLEKEVFENGSAIKAVAEANGVDPQAVIDAIVASEDASVDEMLAAGVISEEEAAEWKAESAEYAAEMVNESFDEMEFGDFDDEMMFEEDMTFDAIAQAIGIDVETLFNELDSGKSIADVATANGVDPQTIIDLWIAEENKFVDELVAAGEITEEEAAEWKAESAEYAPFMVNSVYVDPFVVAAQTIGIDVETLETELFENGASVKTVAEANGVDPQAVIDAVVASENASVDEMLAAGLITDDEATEWKAETAAYVAEMVNESFDDMYFDDIDFEDMDLDEDAPIEDAEASESDA